MKIALSLLLLALASLAAYAASPELDSLAAIRALPPAEADQGHTVKVEGTLTFLDEEGPGLFIHDGENGIFVGMAREELRLLKASPGARLRVEAETRAGEFLPALSGLIVEVIEQGSLPKATRVSQENLFSPGLDCQWVEVPAVIIGAEGEDGTQLVLAAEVFGWTVRILVPLRSDTVQRASELMQQRVTFRAVAGTACNRQRQMTGRYFLMPSLDFISPLLAQTHQSLPQPVRVEDLLRSDTSSLTGVRVRGVVTGVGEGHLYLRGEEGGSIQVLTAQAAYHAPGDRVEAEGFAAVAPFRPVLRARQITEIGDGPGPLPLVFAPPSTRLIELSAELILVEAEVLGTRNEPLAKVLQCQVGDQFFEAMLPPSVNLPDTVKPGCHARLVGNCELLTLQPLPRSQWVDGFRLHLRGPADLAVITPVSWWTLKRILTLTTILAIVVLVVLLSNVVLRRRVRAQTRIIGSQIEQQAVLQERQRIARELHDSIEQEMTGVAIQLRNARRRLDDDPSKAADALYLAQEMIRHCRQEARTSIRDLRSVALQQGGLEGAIQDLIAPFAADVNIQFALHVEGVPRRLEAHVENDVLRVAQEAAANALQHAAPKRMDITLEYGSEEVRLVVKDDGCGFDVMAPPPRGHFGLLGMQERANQRHARLTIDSAPDKGTTVVLTIPTGTPLKAGEPQLQS